MTVAATTEADQDAHGATPESMLSLLRPVRAYMVGDSGPRKLLAGLRPTPPTASDRCNNSCHAQDKHHYRIKQLRALATIMTATVTSPALTSGTAGGAKLDAWAITGGRISVRSG